jgi:hypothetical protein
MLASSDEAVEILPRGWEWSIPFAGSLMVHLACLGFLAAVLVPHLTVSDKQSIDVEVFDTCVAGEADISPLLSNFEGGGPPGGSPEALQVFLPEISSESDRNDLSLSDVSSVLETSEVKSLAGKVSSKKAGGHGSGQGMGNGQGSGNGAGNGQGSGSGNGNGPGSRSFFGLKVQGRSTVFVVDASRSMNRPHPGPSRTRFNRVKLELLRSISKMSEDEQFFIIFFGDGALPMPADRLVPADEEAKRRYLTWMTNVPAVGQTYPQQALLLALRLQPEAIYFLTDGQFDYAVVPEVTAANQQAVPIHTIGFSDNIGEVLLREIAERNRGTYVFIPPDEGGTVDAGETAISIISQLGK